MSCPARPGWAIETGKMKEKINEQRNRSHSQQSTLRRSASITLGKRGRYALNQIVDGDDAIRLTRAMIKEIEKLESAH